MGIPFVCKRKDVVFIRVPKTGSTAVYRTVLNPKTGPGWYSYGQPTHILARDVDDELVEKYRQYTWIGGIRHPYKWIPSLYNWASLKTAPNRDRWLKGGACPHDWYSFVQSIIHTPFDWLEHPEIDVQFYKQEDPTPIEDLLGCKLVEANVTPNPREFKPDAKTRELIERKFHRELACYE